MFLLKTTHSSHLLLPIFVVCLLLCASSLALLRLAASLNTSSAADDIPVSGGKITYATITPVLLDLQSNLPISDGIIYIPQASLQAQTLDNGKTEPLRVPVIKDTRYTQLQEKPWGELLLLAYAEGYAPTAYLCTGIYPDTQTYGPVIRLQPQKSDEIHYTTEEPDSYWLRSLIEKYMPEF